MAALAAIALNSATLAVSTIDMMCQGIGTSRNVGIEIQNMTEEYELRKPKLYTESGYCHQPPNSIIRPLHREGCTFSKRPDAACGTSGVLVYSIYKTPGDYDDKRDQKCDLAIMFSVPYNRVGFSNMFGLDVYKDIHASQDTFNAMYYGPEMQKKRDMASNQVQVRGCGFQLTGTMSLSAQSKIVVVLRDMKDSDLLNIEDRPPQEMKLRSSASYREYTDSSNDPGISETPTDESEVRLRTINFHPNQQINSGPAPGLYEQIKRRYKPSKKTGGHVEGHQDVKGYESS